MAKLLYSAKEGAFGGQYHGPVVVLTHRPPADPPAGITFCGDLQGAAAQARRPRATST